MNTRDMQHEKKSLRERVLTEIQEHGIEPKPRWHFLVHECMVWSVAALSLLVGSVAAALSFYIIDASRFTLHGLYYSDLYTFVEALPYIWLVLLCVGLVYGGYALRQTRRGYRFPLGYVVLGSVALSVLVGGFVHGAGWTEAIDRYLLTTMPSYRPLAGYHTEHWMHKEEGDLVGVIIELTEDAFTLEDLDGDVWTVTVASSTRRPPVPLLPAMRVRVVGTTTPEGVFAAEGLMPWRGRGPGARGLGQGAPMKDNRPPSRSIR